jgi:hypothetical protein
MRAFVFTNLGQPDVHQLQKVGKFTLRVKEFLIRIVATTVVKVLRFNDNYEFKTQSNSWSVCQDRITE